MSESKVGPRAEMINIQHICEKLYTSQLYQLLLTVLLLFVKMKVNLIIYLKISNEYKLCVSYFILHIK